MDEKLTLIEPSQEVKQAYLEMAAEFAAAGERYGDYEKANADFAAFIDGLRRARSGIGLPEGFVPMSTYWLANEAGTILGISRLRHHLTAVLEVEGGNIGYGIRPSARRKGYGTRILALMLEKAAELGLRRVLVTCDTDNIGSARIIEKNGGVMAGQAIAPDRGVQISRYWIEVG